MGARMASCGRTGTETATCRLAGQLAALAWLHSNGTVAGLDEAQRRILAVLDELETAA